VTRNAYDIASSGGAHAGLLLAYADKPTAMLCKAIRTLHRRIDEHRRKIADPAAVLDAGIPERQRRHLVEVKWPTEIRIFTEQIAVLEGMIEVREHDNTS
jgi:hypothetical protein